MGYETVTDFLSSYDSVLGVGIARSLESHVFSLHFGSELLVPSPVLQRIILHGRTLGFLWLKPLCTIICWVCWTYELSFSLDRILAICV
jgi:hypothetical protein